MVARADTVTMFAYSASMNIANFIELYSVCQPATSSCSDSARSNGRRFVSAMRADHVNEERDRLQEDVPARDKSKPRVLAATSTSSREAQRVRDHQDADDRQRQAEFIADHLRRRSHGAHQRILRIRSPAAQHDAVHTQRRDRENEKQADAEIRNLQTLARMESPRTKAEPGRAKQWGQRCTATCSRSSV